MSKRPRALRVRSGPVALTGRDLDILALAGLCRYVSTEQVARECFPSADRARRRLRQLFDAGYLNYTLSSSTAPNLLTLTKQGLETVTTQMPDLAARVRLAGPIRLPEVERHLAGVDARLYAAAWGEARGTPLLRWSPRYGSLARELGLSVAEADAVAEFAGRTGRAYVAVEVAVTPEALRGLPRRLEPYAGTDAVSMVWVVVRDTEAAARVEALPAGSPLGRRLAVLDRTHLAARPVSELPGRAERRAEGPSAPERAPDEPPEATRCFDTEGRPRQVDDGTADG